MKCDIEKLLRENPYPGRGIIIGCSEDGNYSIVLYFVTGRSENSRNRIFEKTEDGIRTKAFDESKMTDPSLIIYRPVRIVGGLTIVSNGSQTDTIWDFITRGDTFTEALHTCEFEPDAPHYTPRISGIVQSGGTYTFSVLKTIEGDPGGCERFFYEYSKAVAGLGHYISTYESDGNPLPPFRGEPVPVSLDGTAGIEAFANKIWDALDNDNKVALYTLKRENATGKIEELIINKNK